MILVSVVTGMVYFYVGSEAMVRFALTMLLTLLSSNIFLIIINALQNLNKMNVSVTIGVSELKPDESMETWLKHADDALYQAKDAGRNRVVRRAEPLRK